ncbi:hypothetical protein [Halalkalicoccus subterraneus]|uniref:hypothetical protein n=1 Tax=Halalkalicoccus subterraneus TaxID=2675002 RepID=UPI000EFBECC0|nr:hypothetical protein [Halalkalicoccus subterraneus]
MTRDTVISVYVSESEKNHLKSEASEEGETLSSYVYKLAQAERKRRGVEKAATDLSAEERIEALIAEAKEDLTEIVEDTKDLNARAGAYSIANFELLKQNHPDPRRQEVLATGARRLRYPLEDHDVTDDSDTTDGSDTDESDSTGSNGKVDSIDELL